MNTPIAIVGLACEFPGASSPEALWDTALHQRRWFRNIHSSRLDAAYMDVLGERMDTTTLRRAAVLEGYQLPLGRFSLGENDVRTADFTHWLALDCATRAIDDSGLGDLLPKESTRVIVGNTLTGESSRADLLRLRWPYVRKTLEESGCTGSASEWEHREHHFKKRLAEIKGRTLAGALSNVIAGRIANHHDLKGGCFCVDAACASSLVAIAQACSQLVSGEIDCAIVGGVDISLDPLELVGFSVAGALCLGEMKVFDEKRTGFIPGEGCGFAVLMRADDPLVSKACVRATIQGWAISSDGHYDLTSPSPIGQRLVLERAYRMAGFNINTVPLFEAHGTGTKVGDSVEVATLAVAIGKATSLASVGSIKANIGHTKAAAGMAGLIKAVKALESEIIPPVTACDEPMRELCDSPALRLVREAEKWLEGSALRAGVSGFGFGGVNAHVVLERHRESGKSRATISPQWKASPAHGGELFVFAGGDRADLVRQVSRVQNIASLIADAEVSAVAKATSLVLKYGPWRAAVIAPSPDELNQHLLRVITHFEVNGDPLDDGCIFGGECSPEMATSCSLEQSTGVTLESLAAAFVAGAVLDFSTLYANGPILDFDLNRPLTFFTNPCELPLCDAVQSEHPAVAPETALDAVHEVLKIEKGKGYQPARGEGNTQTLTTLGVDSFGILEVILDVEKLGFKRRSKTEVSNQMTVSEFAALFDRHTEPGATQPLSDVLEPWVREFEIAWDAAPALAVAPDLSASTTHWTTICTYPLPADFTPRLANGKSGLLVHCDSEVDSTFLDHLLTALREHSEDDPIVILDSTGQLAGFAKTLALEHTDHRILFVHYPSRSLPSVAMIEAELAETFMFREVRCDVAGVRYLPRCQKINQPTDRLAEVPLSSSDVVLVTGGAKGITAECMLALARRTGARFAVVGRSSAEDESVLNTRRRLTEMGIAHHYWALDIADSAAVTRLINEVPQCLGTPITAIIHGAGTHTPCAIKDLTVEKIEDHCRAKVHGLRNLLYSIPAASLKLVIAFGSVIARSGYQRSAAYALANDRLACAVADYQQEYAHIRCLTLDWSAWGELGMGVDLQAIEPLKTAGVDPIGTEAGTTAFLANLHQASPSSRPILAGRLPGFSTVSFGIPDPVIDWPNADIVAFTPGVELVIDLPLSLESFPWLSGHAMRDGKVILPGVLALEIMERMASALAPALAVATAQNIEFNYPITLPAEGQLTVRVQAVLELSGLVTCRLVEGGKALSTPAVIAEFCTPAQEVVSSTQLPPANVLDEDGHAVARDAYAHLLFHSDAFQRIACYSVASAPEAVFHLRASSGLADRVQETVIARDAFIHGIQVCVPGELLLPSKIGRITRQRPAGTTTTIHAREISATSGMFTYEVKALDSSGQLVEHWHDLVLQRYESFDVISKLHPELQAIHQTRSQAIVTRPYFEYRHKVGFKETNVVGNVYFTNHLEWQGRCRELFIDEELPKEEAAALLKALEQGTLALVTVSCECKYKGEVRALDNIAVRMTLEALGPDSAAMRFDYWRLHPDGFEDIIATGRQEIASRRRTEGGLVSTPLPESLVTALKRFADQQARGSVHETRLPNV